MVEPAPLDPQSAAVIAALSRPPLGPYLAAAQGNEREALRFYQWNIGLSGAVYEALHVFEVFLRNAIDVELSSWNATQVERGTGRQHSQDWLLDPARLAAGAVGVATVVLGGEQWDAVCDGTSVMSSASSIRTAESATTLDSASRTSTLPRMSAEFHADRFAPSCEITHSAAPSRLI